MKKLSMMFLIILLIPSISNGFEPFFKGKWGDTPDTIKRLETRELISDGEFSQGDDLPNMTGLEYIEISPEYLPEQEINIWYFFNDDRLARVWLRINDIENVDDVYVKSFFENLNNRIINELDNNNVKAEISKLKTNSESGKKTLWQMFYIRDKASLVNVLSFYYIFDSRLHCEIDFADANDSYNIPMLDLFNRYCEFGTK